MNLNEIKNRMWRSILLPLVIGIAIGLAYLLTADVIFHAEKSLLEGFMAALMESPITSIASMSGILIFIGIPVGYVLYLVQALSGARYLFYKAAASHKKTTNVVCTGTIILLIYATFNQLFWLDVAICAMIGAMAWLLKWAKTGWLAKATLTLPGLVAVGFVLAAILSGDTPLTDNAYPQVTEVIVLITLALMTIAGWLAIVQIVLWLRVPTTQGSGELTTGAEDIEK